MRRLGSCDGRRAMKCVLFSKHVTSAGGVMFTEVSTSSEQEMRGRQLPAIYPRLITPSCHPSARVSFLSCPHCMQRGIR